MPSGVYKKSEEHKNKLRLLRLGKKLTEEQKMKLRGKPSPMKGKKHTERAKQLNREKHIGKGIGNQNGFKKGMIPHNKGKKSPWTSARNKIDNKKNFSGANSHFWKGGITKPNKLIRGRPEYEYWRKSCFERDNFTCQKYGTHGGDLVVHHINNFAEFPELRFITDNGITLSKKAHREFHNKYGYKNNTLEQLNEFLNSKQHD